VFVLWNERLGRLRSLKSSFQLLVGKKSVIALAFYEKPILYGLFFTQEDHSFKIRLFLLGCTLKAHGTRDFY
jgi:hypothetical protein